MAIKTPASFVPPANAIPGSGAGKPLYRTWDRSITDDGQAEVNFADTICLLNDPLSGEALNVNVSSSISNANVEQIDFNSRDLVYLGSVATGLDTLNDYTCVFNEALVPETRNAEPSGAGNDEIFFDPFIGGATLGFDAQGLPAAPYVNESKTIVKLTGTGRAYAFHTGTFQDTGASTLPAQFFIEVIGTLTGEIAQSNWNIDPLDGTGDSGIDLDFATSQTLVIKIDLDNRGSSYFGFLLEDVIYYAHKHINENVALGTLPVNYPLRDQVTRNGAILTRKIGLFDQNGGFVFISKTDSTSAPAAIVIQTLSDSKAVKVKSNQKDFVLPFTAGNRETSKVVTAPNTPLCSVRTRPWFDEAPPTVGLITNKTVWTIDQLHLYASGPDLNKGCYIRVFYNAALTADNFTVLPGNSESRMLQDVAATAVTGGFELFSCRILTDQVYTFYAKDIFKNYRNYFAYNRITEPGLPGEFTFDQTITIVATPMDATDTLEVAATIIGGEVG